MGNTYNSRVRLKHDTEANWQKAVNFIPLASELIIYDPDSIYNYVRVKVGDGITKINNLPFSLNVDTSKLPLTGGTVNGDLIVNNIIKASTVKVTEDVALTYDSSNKCLNFNFS